YYLTHYALGYGPFIKFDHDFIGREALEQIAKGPHRKKVTFAWNAEDVLKIFASLLVPGGENYKYFDFPNCNYASSSFDKIVTGTKTVGFSMFGGYSYNERTALSLGVVDPDIEIGDVLATIERLRGTTPLPRAAFFHMRTLEMFRCVGIESRMREQSARDFAPEGAVIVMDCLAGRKLADIIANLNEGVEAVSPCRRLFLNQPSLEPLLRERAREAGATIIQGAQIIDVRQDSNGVSVTEEYVDGGNMRELRA